MHETFFPTPHWGFSFAILGISYLQKTGAPYLARIDMEALSFPSLIGRSRALVYGKLETAGNANGNPQKCKGEIPGIASGH